MHICHQSGPTGTHLGFHWNPVVCKEASSGLRVFGATPCAFYNTKKGSGWAGGVKKWAQQLGFRSPINQHSRILGGGGGEGRRICNHRGAWQKVKPRCSISAGAYVWQKAATNFISDPRAIQRLLENPFCFAHGPEDPPTRRVIVSPRRTGVWAWGAAVSCAWKEGGHEASSQAQVQDIKRFSFRCEMCELFKFFCGVSLLQASPQR